jgi:hypothetical protein
VSTQRNDFFDFIIAETKRLADEYGRVQGRVKEDPGTAGDQGEENWASVLRQWLPREYPVVTKGRILGHNGQVSPQVDVIVLHPSYPPSLLDKKLYLAGGVAAAFECKLTLDAGHITKAVENCAAIKRLTVKRTGSPLLELNSPLVYGLLAHSHSWREPGSKPIENVTRQLAEKDRAVAKHPRETLDIACVADLATWVVGKYARWPEGFPHGYSGRCTTALLPYVQPQSAFRLLSPMGLLLLTVFKRLAWEDPRLRRIATHFSLALNDYLGGGEAMPRFWEPNEVYSERVRDRLSSGCVEIPTREVDGVWDEWLLLDCPSSTGD